MVRGAQEHDSGESITSPEHVPSFRNVSFDRASNSESNGSDSNGGTCSTMYRSFGQEPKWSGVHKNMIQERVSPLQSMSHRSATSQSIGHQILNGMDQIQMVGHARERIVPLNRSPSGQWCTTT